jgi:hypothetical protein
VVALKHYLGDLMKIISLSALLLMILANSSFAGCDVYKSADSWEKIGYLSRGIIYASSSSWTKTGCFGVVNSRKIYRNCNSWEEIGYWSFDRVTIYKNANSNEKVGYFSRLCTDDDFRR